MRILTYFKYRKLQKILSKISDYTVTIPDIESFRTIASCRGSDFIISIPEWTKVDNKYISTKKKEYILVKSDKKSFYFQNDYLLGKNKKIRIDFSNIEEQDLKGIFSKDRETSLICFILFIKKYILNEREE